MSADPGPTDPEAYSNQPRCTQSMHRSVLKMPLKDRMEYFDESAITLLVNRRVTLVYTIVTYDWICEDITFQFPLSESGPKPQLSAIADARKVLGGDNAAPFPRRRSIPSRSAVFGRLNVRAATPSAHTLTCRPQPQVLPWIRLAPTMPARSMHRRAA